MTNFEIDLQAFQNEAAEQNAKLLQRCMLLAGRVAVLERKVSEFEELEKAKEKPKE